MYYIDFLKKVSRLPKIKNIFSIIFAQGVPTLLLLYLIYLLSYEENVAPKLALLTIFITAMINDLGLSKTLHFVIKEKGSRKVLPVIIKDIPQIIIYSILGGIFLYLCNMILNQDDIFNPSLIEFSLLTLTTIIFVIVKAIYESNGFFKLNIICTLIYTCSLPILFLYLGTMELDFIFNTLLYSRLLIVLLFLLFLFLNKMIFISDHRNSSNLFNLRYAFSMILVSLAMMSERIIILITNLASLGIIYFVLEFSNRFLNISALLSHAIFVWSQDNNKKIQLNKFNILKWAILISSTFYVVSMFALIMIMPNIELDFLFVSIILSYVIYFLALKVNVELLFLKDINNIYLANIPSLIFFIFLILNPSLINIFTFSIFLIIKSSTNLIIQILIQKNTFKKTNLR